MAQHENAVLVKSDTIRDAAYDDLEKMLKGEVVANQKDPRAKKYLFMDFSLGAGFYDAEENRFANNWLTRNRIGAQFSIGQWVLPHIAVRLGLGYNRFVGDYAPIRAWNVFEPTDHFTIPDEAKQYYYTDENGKQWFSRQFDLVDAQANIIWDVNSAFTKRKTPFDTYIYAGAGYSHVFSSQGIKWNNSFSFKAGFSVSYNLTEKFYLRSAIEGTICDETLDGQYCGTNTQTNRTIEGYMQCFFGVGVKLQSKKYKKFTFTRVNNIERTYTPLQTFVTEDYTAPFVVRFFIDQYNIETDQELNIAKVGKYLQENPSARLKMTGHADPETASSAYNQKLSERRCKAVLKYLDQHFGIDHSRIDVIPMGDTERNFKEDFRWNRCVILTIIDK